ncbi:hypothetical protein AB4Y72_08615 [Arthrobacter sp. YAF34]|uniref:hypothetical protein n=1 Tax=Arthrobacter sp. YAF34 TaxID=3233083 RepID=UPI003F935F73
MALDRTSLRTDIGYLSRRRKAATQPEPLRPAAQIAATSPELGTSRPSPSGLTLGANRARSGGLTLDARPAPAPSAKASVASEPGPRPAPHTSERLFPAPDFGSVRELGEANPVVRLNARQSAIGSLLVTGVRSVAWEDQQLTTGAHHVEGHKAGTAILTPGNRPLAGMQDGAGIVSLRHVRLVRRLLFVAGETPMTIGVFDGAAAAISPRNDAGLRSVLYFARVGALLELRAEFVAADASDAAIWAIFGFNMTIPLDQRVLLR